jgi:hypothetical protein
MMIWKKYIVFFINILCCLAPTQTAFSCGYDALDARDFSFLTPNMLSQTQHSAAYFLGFNDFYKDQKQTLKYKDNIDEWHERFCGEVERADINYVVYESTIDELTALDDASNHGNTKGLSTEMAKNSFAIHLFSQSCGQVINYLIFAKKCEPFAMHSSAWADMQRNREAMNELITQGIRYFGVTKSHFVKLRFAYQIIRLAHYMKDYERVLSLCAELIPKIDNRSLNTSILKYWVMAHRAGALLKLGNRGEAAYLFSMVFQHCLSKREAAYLSFSIKNEREWKDCLAFCKNNKERSTLYALRATTAGSGGLEEVKNVYSLDPSSEHLEALMAREIQYVEKRLLVANVSEKNQQRGTLYLRDLKTFIEKCIKDGYVPNLLFWRTAVAYLEGLSGSFTASTEAFKKLKIGLKNEQKILQIDMFELAARIHGYQILSEENQTDAELVRNMRIYNKDHNFPKFMSDRFAYLFKEAGYPGRAFRCKHTLSELSYHPKMEMLDDLIGLSKKFDKNAFERALVIDNFGSFQYRLLEMRGTLLLANGQTEAADACFKQVPRNERQRFNANMFRESVNDCVNCTTNRDTLPSYDKGQLAAEMLRMEYEAKVALDRAAPIYYDLGLMHYNTTYFGNAYMLMDYFRSGSSWYSIKNGTVFPHEYAPLGNRENFDCTRALGYFKKTMEMSHDPELCAKAAFMAAKCHQKMYFVSPDNEYDINSQTIPKMPLAYTYYYKYLHANYSKTKFYAKVRTECKYFGYYALR